MQTNQRQKMEVVFIKLKKDMVGLFGIQVKKGLMFVLYMANLNKVSTGHVSFMLAYNGGVLAFVADN
jgi:hypothetical protein